MSEESEAEKIKLEDDLKKVMRQLRLFLRIYDPDKYEVDILVVNKADWIKKVEDGYDNVLEVMFRNQGINLLSAADVENLTKNHPQSSSSNHLSNSDSVSKTSGNLTFKLDPFNDTWKEVNVTGS